MDDTKTAYEQNTNRVSILVKNTSWTYVAKIAVQVLSLAVSVLVIKRLDVTVFGTFSLLLGSKLVIDVFANSPLTTVYGRYIPELVQGNNYRQIRQLVIRGTVIGLSVGFVLITLIVVLREPFSAFFNIPDFNAYLTAFGVFLFCNQLQTLTDSMVKALLLHKEISLINILTSLTRSLLYVALMRFLNVTILLYVEAFAAAGYALLGLLIYARHMRAVGTVRDKLTAGQVSSGRMVKYGLYSALNELGADLVGKASDSYVVAALSGQYEVGLYAFANRLYGMVFQILPVKDFMSVLRPLFIQKFTEDRSEESLVRMYNFMVKVMLPVYLFPAVVFFLFGRNIIDLVFDPKYAPAYWVLAIMLLSNFSTAFFYPLSLVMSLKERMDLALLSKVVAVVSFPVGIYAMKYFGIVGVATVTAIGEAFKYLFIFVLIQKSVTLTYHLKGFLGYLLVEAGLVGLFYWINTLIHGLVGLAGGVLVFTVLSALLFVAFHPFTKDELGILSRMSQSTRLLQRVTLLLGRLGQCVPQFSKH